MQVALSTTEDKYIAMSEALHDVLPIMFLIQEIKAKGFQVICTKPYIYCKDFEDNSGALELARLPKLRPRTKHISTKLHHFRDYVAKKEISIHPIATASQPADFLTKPLKESQLVIHRKTVMGW